MTEDMRLFNVVGGLELSRSVFGYQISKRYNRKSTFLIFEFTSEDAHAVLGEKKISSLDDFTECPICMCRISSAMVTTCGHRFCEGCIHKWIAQTSRCPCCNKAVTAAQLIKDRQYDNLIDTLKQEKYKAEAKYSESKTSGPPNTSLGIRQPNPQMSQVQGPMNTVATMATSSHLTGAIQSKPGLVGVQVSQPGQPDMQGAVGGAMPLVSQGGANVQMTVAQPLSPGPNMGTNQTMSSQGMMNPNSMGNPGMDPSQGLGVGQMNPPQLVGAGPGQPVQGTTGTLPEAGANQLANRTIIWRGQLEWQDKKSMGPMQGASSRITRNLLCMVSIGQTDPEINTSNWPSTLIMQLMPQTLLNSNQLHPFFRNSRQVAFNFPNLQSMDHLRNLYKVMGNGFAGCVHLTSNTPCEIRVLLLLFSNKRKQFVGFIPNDQSGVVNGIRQVITQHKQRMQQIPQNPLGAPGGVATGGMPRMDQPNMGMGGPQPGPGPSQGPQMGGGAMGMQPGVRPGMRMDQDSQMMRCIMAPSQTCTQFSNNNNNYNNRDYNYSSSNNNNNNSDT